MRDVLSCPTSRRTVLRCLIAERRLSKNEPVNDQERAERALIDLEPLLAAHGLIYPATTRRYKRGGRDAPAKGWVRVGGLELSLTRSIGFSTWEADLLDPYGHALEDLRDVPDPIARIAVEDIVLRALAVQLGQEQAEVVEEAVRFLYRAATNTYEGQAVHINLLLDRDLRGDGTKSMSLRDYEQVDWHALLGSGLHTGILVNRDGQVVRVLDVQGNADESLEGYTLYSEAFRELAAWTTVGANRIVLSLSRSREIVVHQDGLLRYIHRSGRWRVLALDHAVDSGWATGSSFSKSLKRAVLASAIDASLGITVPASVSWREERGAASFWTRQWKQRTAGQRTYEPASSTVRHFRNSAEDKGLNFYPWTERRCLITSVLW